ncbi:MAG TPA: hypothetical protein ENI42_06320 [Thermoplasmatales archaeon]|nr:hypothetical protein [Thermoplasmatales archaeon]
MVEINDIEKRFRKFRNDFWEDVTEINAGESKIDTEELKTKMMESDYFKTIKTFAEERGWNVTTKDLTLAVQKEGEEKTVEVTLVDTVEENKLFIQPWSRVLQKLENLKQ